MVKTKKKDARTSNYSTDNLTEENVTISRKLKQTLKSKYENYWLSEKIEEKWNNVVMATHLSSSNSLVCQITCFCKDKIKINKLSRSPTTKARWIYSNYHSHFEKKHALKNNSMVKGEVQPTAKQSNLMNFLTQLDSSSNKDQNNKDVEISETDEFSMVENRDQNFLNFEEIARSTTPFIQ